MALRIVVFFSGGASGLRYLFEEDSNYGEKYKIVGGFTDSPGCKGEKFAQNIGIDVKTNDIEEFYGDIPVSDLKVRKKYDRKTLDLIDEFNADLILLSGYMWILTEPIIEKYRIINVHPADLRVKKDNKRLYTGKNPVYDAIINGENQTYSSIHFVKNQVDEGPLFVVSPGFNIHEKLVDVLLEKDKREKLKKYSEAHQEWMKWEGDGPAISKAIELLAEKNIEIKEGDVYIEGEKGPYLM